MKSKYTFVGEQKITATFVSGNYIWIAFYGVANKCTLYKSSIFNPNLIYWDVKITGDKINYIIEDTTYLYLALDDSIYIGAKVTKNNPSIITYFTKHVSLTEKAIDLTKDSTYIYFLIPGIDSGTNTKIAKYNASTRAYVETIDLATLNNTTKIDIDIDGVLWTISDLDSTPSITKIWYDISWHYTNYILS